jgi:hypothetical protein
MVDTAIPDGKTAAAKCLRRLGLSGLSNWSAHCIQLRTLSDEGQKCLLAESGLVRSLADMVATAIPDGKTAAANCLWYLAYSGLLNLVCPFYPTEDMIR